MKRTLMIGLLVFLTISVGMLISCSGEIRYVEKEKIDTKTDFVNYMMKSGDEWFDSFKVLYPGLGQNHITSIIFTSDTEICKGLTPTDLTQLGTKKVNGYVSGTDINYEIYIVGGEIYGNFNCNNMFGYFDSLISIKNLDLFNTSYVTNMSGMFTACPNLTTLNLCSLNTSNVTNMKEMFMDCCSLTQTDFSNFETKKVTDMSGMFMDCSALETLKLSSFDTSNVTTMAEMFYVCSSLTGLDLSNFETSNVTDMSSMFNNCSGLQTLDLKNWNTTRVRNMDCMFYSCKELTSLDVSSFNPCNVTKMSSMFCDCENLTSIDLGSNFNTPNVGEMDYMFANCNNLTSITDCSKFNTERVTNMNSMFSECFSLTNLNLTSFNIELVSGGREELNTECMFDCWTPENYVKVATAQVGDGTWGWSAQSNIFNEEWTSSTDASGVTYTKP